MANLVVLDVDYSRIGDAERFTAPLFLYEIDELEEGGLVVINGDSVPKRVARVLKLDVSSSSGEFEFTTA